MKNLFDKLVSVFGIIILSPVFLVIAVLIKLTSRGEIFFSQQRIGQNGKVFTMYKFRTMHPNDDKNTITRKGDVRITNIGAYLRKYKVDELPELWNVLIGDMSFVGPRPDVPGYADKLTGESRRILKLKPGITGPASLKYADEEDLLSKTENSKKFNDEVIFPDKVRINLQYLENHTLCGDIRIIFLTIFRNKPHKK